MKPTVGVIGLGLRGKPMGRNLLKAGFPLVVWNRTAARADELVSEGAKLGANPRETAAAADVLITIVSDPPALEEVLWGAQGAMQGLRRGSIYMDSSTISPELARRAAAACAERGVDFLDAPVTGGDWGAKKGELVFMIGGKAEVLERAQPVLDRLGKKFFLLGSNGAGQTEKLVEVMQSSMARAGVLDVKAPLMLKNEYAASFPLRLMHKDMRLALELARQQGVSLPAASAAYATYSAVKDASKDDPDYSAVARFWSKTGG